MSEPLKIDFAEPSSIVDGIPRVERLIIDAERERERSERAVSEAQARAAKAASDAESWQALLNVLLARARVFGVPAPTSRQADPAPNLKPGPGPEPEAAGSEHTDSKAMVLDIMNREPAAMSIGDVSAMLPMFKRKTISWALWKLADDGDIKRLGHGAYAPLSYQLEELVPDLNGTGQSLTREAVKSRT